MVVCHSFLTNIFALEKKTFLDIIKINLGGACTHFRTNNIKTEKAEKDTIIVENTILSV